MKILEPDYASSFRCLAGACPDTCCKDWEIILDEDTLARYQELPGAFGDEVRAALTQDAEQGILTYEDILALPPERIAAADYRALEGVNCIYVETEPDDAGYVERYWVSVSSGLLAAAERECDGAVVYRMAALTVSYDGVDAEDFTLPNGTVLYEPVVAAAKEISEND